MTEFIIYLISMSFTPGPNVVLATANASQKGFPKCLSLNMGMFAGVTLIHIICYFTVTYLVSVISALELWLKVLGIVYLLWLSWSLFKKGTVGKSSESGGFKKGFVLQFLNVKLYMMAVTSVSTFVIPMKLSLLKGLLVTLIGPISCIASLMLWSCFGIVLTKFYSKHTRLFNAFFGLSLLILAVSNISSLLA